MHHIRTSVFRIRQAEMAQIVGVAQSTVSRWEKGLAEPSLSEIARIRQEAIKRRIRWKDAWFFQSVTPANTSTGEGAAA